mmetsp:Transcript_6569/g.23248  ORF Transcript_6569/g.23248 Transcript_6569/m.23248 type:complete len:102 (-) Transcript_6569:1103-1408(-)
MDEVLAVMNRFDDIIENCSKELRNYNECTLSLGADRCEAPKEKLISCQRRMELQVNKIRNTCVIENEDYHRCMAQNSSNESCLHALKKLFTCTEKVVKSSS